MDVSSCRRCGYEWVDPVHFLHKLEVGDFLRPERILVLAKYRLQTDSRRLMFNLCAMRPYSLREVEANHVELLKGHTQELNKAAGMAGALGRRLKQLVDEFVRFGREGFTFTENAYFEFSRGHLSRHVAVESNALMLRMRAAFRVARLPGQRTKFAAFLHKSMLQARINVVKAMVGWTISKKHVQEAFGRLQVTHDKLLSYFTHVLNNVSADVLAGGSNFTVMLSQAGVPWSFGAGADGRLGQDTGTVAVRPHIILMARPKHEAYMSNASRTYVEDASVFGGCTLGAGKVTNVKAGGVLYFDGKVVPPSCAGVRFRVRAQASGANVTLRADEAEGIVLASATVLATPAAEDGEPQWASLEAPFVTQTHQEPRTLVLVFGDDNACDMEWFEFFAETVDRPGGFFADGHRVTKFAPEDDLAARAGLSKPAADGTTAVRAGAGIKPPPRPVADITRFGRQRQPPSNGRGWP